MQHIPIPVAVSYLEFLNTRKTQTSAFSSLLSILFVFLKKKKGGSVLPRGMMMKSLHSNSQFCCKHVGFSYIFAKGIIARDTLPKAKE